MSDSQGRIRSRDVVRKTAGAAIGLEQIDQWPDGRAAVYTGTSAATSGQLDTNWTTEGQYTITKATGVVLLDGGRVYWDHSANAATFRRNNDRDFYLGVAVGDAASADTTVAVNLNVWPKYETQLAGEETGVWTCEATNGLGVTPLPGGGVQLYFDAVAEAAMAAMYSERTFPVNSNPIMEVRFAVVNQGDNSALDLDIGMANGTHATDFESVTEFVAVHLDGNTLDLDAHSDDGTTDVAPTDTTINLTAGTYVEVWLDLRNPSDIQIYVDGVLVLGSTVFTLAAAAGPIFPIVHMEKTSDDTVGDLRIDFLRVRTQEG